MKLITYRTGEGHTRGGIVVRDFVRSLPHTGFDDVLAYITGGGVAAAD